MVTVITVPFGQGNRSEGVLCHQRLAGRIFPRKRMRDSEHIEEERRVLYVALTRAQKRVDHHPPEWEPLQPPMWRDKMRRQRIS